MNLSMNQWSRHESPGLLQHPVQEGFPRVGPGRVGVGRRGEDSLEESLLTLVDGQGSRHRSGRMTATARPPNIDRGVAVSNASKW